MFHLFAVVCKFGITKGGGLPDRALDIIHSQRGILGFHALSPFEIGMHDMDFFQPITDNYLLTRL